ncbi:hypothetical protein RBB50_003277 [Rhinocladiella similis]
MVQATAYVVRDAGSRFERVQVDLDRLRDHEVLVDLTATGICHTDIAVQHGKIPVPLPAILGHEGAGIVREVGSAVAEIQPGDHVVLSYNSCQSCRGCQEGKPYQCGYSQRLNFGGSRADGSSTVVLPDKTPSTCFFGQSSFCNPTIAQEASCVKINNKLPLSVVCALGCGFQTGAGSIYNVVKPLERRSRHIVIFGIGPVGCAAIMAAHQLSKSTSNSEPPFQIIAVDLNSKRLELANELGAQVTINPGTQSVRDSIMEITQGQGVDAAVDCTGVVSIVEQMVELIASGGIAVTVGGPSPGLKAAIDVFGMLIKCKTYCGSHQGNADSKKFIPWLADLYTSGHFPLERLQTTYRPDKINEACKDMAEGRVLKPILLWD